MYIHNDRFVPQSNALFCNLLINGICKKKNVKIYKSLQVRNKKDSRVQTKHASLLYTRIYIYNMYVFDTVFESLYKVDR